MSAVKETENAKAELSARHKSTRKTVLSLIVAVVLLCVLAFVSQRFLTARSNPPLDIGVRITILIFGLGAIVLRRTRFAKMRLQDIAAVRGPSGLIITLQHTTLLISLIAILIALIGFIATLMTATPAYTLLAGIVAVAVLLYAYPVRVSWEQALRQYGPEETDTNVLQLSEEQEPKNSA